VAVSPSPSEPDLGERFAKLAVILLLAGLVWGTLLGAVRILTALTGWAFH
jgi:hypothetical protein